MISGMGLRGCAFRFRDATDWAAPQVVALNGKDDDGRSPRLGSPLRCASSHFSPRNRCVTVAMEACASAHYWGREIHGARPRSEAGSTDLRGALRQEGEERRSRRGGDHGKLRSDRPCTSWRPRPRRSRRKEIFFARVTCWWASARRRSTHFGGWTSDPLSTSGTSGEEVARVWRFPPFKPVFPAFAARSSKVQYGGRKRRSCSPVSS